MPTIPATTGPVNKLAILKVIQNSIVKILRYKNVFEGEATQL
jgi:hypothetical protein